MSFIGKLQARNSAQEINRETVVALLDDMIRGEHFCLAGLAGAERIEMRTGFWERIEPEDAEKVAGFLCSYVRARVFTVDGNNLIFQAGRLLREPYIGSHHSWIEACEKNKRRERRSGPIAEEEKEVMIGFLERLKDGIKGFMAVEPDGKGGVGAIYECSDGKFPGVNPSPRPSSQRAIA